MFGRSQGPLAVAAYVLGLGACSAPSEHTDLRPDGPPEVLAVLAADDTAGEGVVETATFCKLRDDKRPELIPANPDGPDQVCPDDLAAGAEEVIDTVPISWYVRIQFDELLDPHVEDLISINDSSGQPTGLSSGTLATTQPVTLTCGGTKIPYDGYYDPSGNSYTWPVGPSLVVSPNDTSSIPTGSECEISVLPKVTDKDGLAVPAAQLGPYKFKIAPLALVDTSPKAGDLTAPSTIDAASPLSITFNAPIAVSSVVPAEVMIADVDSCDAPTTSVAHTAEILPGAGSKTSVKVRDSGAAAGDAWLRGKTYLITFAAGATVKDLAGGEGQLPADLTICFKTAP
jgi:Big-like domain-containing protein